MYRNILLPVDLDDRASWERSLPVAVEYARSFGSTLHVMTVVPDFGMSVVGSFFPDDFAKNALAEADRQLHAFVRENVPAGVAVRHCVEHGRIYAEIIKTAGEVGADLIVISAHRPELKDYLLGPNAARVARHAAQSVLIVR